MIRPVAFDVVGLWDERFFIYYDDVDWSWRASRRGLRLLYLPSVRVKHVGGHTMKKRAEFAEYCLCKGRVLFMRKHARLHQWPLFVLGLALTLAKPLLVAACKLKKPEKTMTRYKAFLDGFRADL